MTLASAAPANTIWGDDARTQVADIEATQAACPVRGDDNAADHGPEPRMVSEPEGDMRAAVWEDSLERQREWFER